MATLKKLIEDGLQVGALVELQEFPLHCIAQWNGEIFVSVIDNGWHLEGDTVFDDDGSSPEWQPTTAHDAGIDRNTLPIVEPFWTGWIVASHLDGPYKQFPNNRTEEDAFTAATGWLQIELDSKPEKKWQWPHKSHCQPCLPPKD
jgi:hypothetical protein